jgi:fused signal recognition particle receptor
MKFADKIKSFFLGRSSLSEELFDDLADLLVEGDFGARESMEVIERLRELGRKEKYSPAELPEKLALLLENELMKAPSPSFPFTGGSSGRPTVILLLGVNGTGKTTTAAKLANLARTQFGLKPILAAADTFRAAAIDQLKIHGQRLEARVVAHRQGGDPAAVVYDALEAAHAGGGDVIIADTAGRMHTKAALVEELRKIDRVVNTKAGEGRLYLKYLVLDATTGRNALAQAEIFHQAIELDGIILTKYDSTAKGGVVFSLACDLRLPVLYLCTGEKYGDIETFDPKKYAREFAGIE